MIKLLSKGSLTDLAPVIIRCFLYGVVGLEAFLIIPLLQNPLGFGVIEFAKSVGQNAVYALLGSATGFLIIGLKSDFFCKNSFIKFGHFTAVIVAIAVGLYSKSALNGLCVLFYTIVVVSEKINQIDGKYIKASVGKPILSILIVGSLMLNQLLHVSDFAMVELSLISGILVVYSLDFKDNYQALKSVVDFKSYFRLIKAGLMANLSTIFFGFFLLADRITIKKFGLNQLNDYSLVMLFNAIGLTLLSSFSFKYVVDVAKNPSTGTIGLLNTKNLMLFAVGLVSCIISISLFFLAPRFKLVFISFQDSVILIPYIACYFAFNVISMLTSKMMYEGKVFRSITIINGSMFALNTCLNLFIVKFEYIYVKTTGLFLLSSLAMLFFYFRSLKGSQGA